MEDVKVDAAIEQLGEASEQLLVRVVVPVAINVHDACVAGRAAAAIP